MSFTLRDFLPYLLNQAAETSSQEFQNYYRATFGMLRTEWRVLFHLGCFGDMTARDICTYSSLHKTKVSRAVRALEQKRFLVRETLESDRRTEKLSLTNQGKAAFSKLLDAAQEYDQRLSETLTEEELAILRKSLKKLAGLDPA